VCSAYYLAQRGMNVLLIEKGAIGSGCSSGNGGLIVPSHAIPLASPGALGNGLRWLFDSESPFYIKPRLDLDLVNWLIRFALASRPQPMVRALQAMRDLLRASRDLYDELSQIASFGFEGNGSLQVFSTERGLQGGVEEARLLEKFDIPIQVMSAAEVCNLEPALRPGLMGGVYYPRDGHIDPFRFVTGLAEKARELGAEILTGTEVLGFETKDGRVITIKTTRGDVTPQQIVLAAGSWSPEVARALKLDIPIQAAKGYSITFEKPVISPKIPLLFGEAHVVVNPLKNALRVAGTLELAGMDFSINLRRVNAIRKATEQYLPGLDQARVLEIWRGLRPCTPDGLPIISRSDSFDNLFIAAGHAMLGMSLGPITGKLVSQVVNEERTDFNLAPFRLNRFSRLSY
ncbi:MAG TPA: FAD-dependent oxidoreductase, partial [Anaerolineales bacterium]|nr:FAD-dependent oxidoreductase [Anaerolineales bacterium]